MKISTVLDHIDSGHMALPEFQRGYVWNRDQVRALFDSLYRRHPIGGSPCLGDRISQRKPSWRRSGCRENREAIARRSAADYFALRSRERSPSQTGPDLASRSRSRMSPVYRRTRYRLGDFPE